MKASPFLVLCLSLATAFGQVAEEPQATNLITEGDFEVPSGDFYSGWTSSGFLGGKPETQERWDNAITAENEVDGTPFARLKCADLTGTSVAITQTEPVLLDPQWTDLTLSAEIRVENYGKNSPWGGRAQMTMYFFDSNEQEIAGEQFVGVQRDTTDWEPLQKSFIIPPGAVSVKVGAQIIGANGVMDVRKISLTSE